MTMWVFGYGSLLWNPGFPYSEKVIATLPGWHRSFCMRLEGGRGSHDRPGLMAALDEGGQCDGVVFRINADLVDQETRFMWHREMFAGSYQPLFFDVETPQGSVEALVFVMDTTNNRYMPDVPRSTAARMIALAEGGLGPNFTYLDSLVRHLDELGLEDEEVRLLHAKAREIREATINA